MIGSIKSLPASSGSFLKSRENLGADPTFQGKFFKDVLDGPDGSGFTLGFFEGFAVVDGFKLSQPLFIAAGKLSVFPPFSEERGAFDDLYH